MTTRPRASDDDGFTLIELLMAVMILGVLFSGLTAAMMVSLDSLVGRSQSVTDTTGAQLLSAYLVADAQSADYVNPTQLAAGDANSFTCDDGKGTRVLLELRWTDADGATGTSDVVYRVEPTSATDYRLVRDLYAVTLASKSCSLTAQTVVVSDVSSDPSATTALCTGGCGNNPLSVGLHVSACVSDANNNTCDPSSSSYAPYVFDVYGTRRTL